MSLRLLCRWFGCDTGEHYDPACVRCHEHIYEGAFLENGIWWTIRRRLDKFTLARCGQCRVLLRPLHLYRGAAYMEFCSQKCEDEWIPF